MVLMFPQFSTKTTLHSHILDRHGITIDRAQRHCEFLLIFSSPADAAHSEKDPGHKFKFLNARLTVSCFECSHCRTSSPRVRSSKATHRALFRLCPFESAHLRDMSVNFNFFSL